MHVQVLSKVAGNTETIDANSVDLQSPSIVRLKIAPEAVRSFERQGADLKLVLLSGETVLIQNFFVQDGDGNRSDLVLEDAAGVLWWGQYSAPWSEFHFTEIETDTAVSPWWLLGGLGLLGLAAGSGGGGGGDGGGDNGQPEHPQRPVVDINDIDVIVNPATGDTAIITGTLTVPPGTVPHSVTVTVDGVQYSAQVNPDGTWNVTVPAENLTENTPVTAIGSFIDPKTGEVSEPSDPSDNVIPVKFTPEVDAPPVATDEDGPVAGKVAGFAKNGDPLAYAIPDTGKPAHGVAVIDPKTGEYTYTPNPDFNGNDSFIVTVSDGHGGVTTTTVNVTVTPVADITDDVAITDKNTPVSISVPDNDDFEDANRLITHVGGQAIAVGGSVAVDKGMVTLQSDGSLIFAPATGWAGVTSFAYTVTSGGVTETTTVKVNVVGVDIVDDASPDAPGAGDNVLASIDNLQSVVINGQTPVGGTITGLTVTDGTNTVTIDIADIIQNPDGSFSTTTDLTGLADGELTVELEVEDSGGVTSTLTDTIDKDTVAQVAIDPLLVVNGQVPTITGTSDGNEITLTINGGTVTVPVGPGGIWSYTPPAPLDSATLAISANTVDPWGNSSTAVREVVSLVIDDQAPSDDAHVTVHESGLSDGSDGSASTESVNATFTLGSAEGDITHIVIGGSVVAGQLNGGTLITLAQLQGLPGTPIAAITTEYGSLLITSYDPATGVVGYTYTLVDNTTDHSVGGNDIVRDSIQLAVVDNNGDTRVDQLQVAVVDDAPTANDDTATVAAGSFLPVSGNVIDGAGADVPGAERRRRSRRSVSARR